MQSLIRRPETTRVNFAELAEAAFAARRKAGLALVADAGALTQACRSMATRFNSGGKLFAFGDGLSSTDAAHIAVEFVHPVIVGKRALPAFALSNHVAALSGIAGRMGWDQVYAHQLRILARPGDIALALAGDPVSGDVAAALEASRKLGLLSIALTTGDAAVKADHLLPAHSSDSKVVKELRVTMYHLLWELVHVFLEQPALLESEATPVRPEPGASRRLRLEAQTNEGRQLALTLSNGRDLGSETSCHDAVCITCSDSAVQVRVVELLEAGMARVEAGGAIEEINTELVDAEVGAVLLVHAGVAIGRVQ